ncbi:group II intron reverse transcriptase/maturase [Bacillus salipaludis]|uniref:Group II intron reverse transcriptase/maturase n=1 Tax=Bacillus salipaludis TaxID=2547811 RepID=A0A4R5VIE1_9BACI|nr:group II intron reverse transcriptase/maturase [Bacillus salipaludis]MDQ6596339.1 group II intron reverse transcriptase/maturase [Bacillus salipaludis]MDQ6596409.1 group II intron reverse transcriptase/maturase [Bacillus salipaludis]MDQ6596446.1 group II intron reverse transcriptase/maturase [Bacillus salipaludis]MDQ6597845.1 group II intron reverse transcriptase/maturase [Bacillus salipaludis]MDQ6597920.1 group II intron reverse transcriptase/maturase [Bacillus salipaludis]
MNQEWKFKLHSVYGQILFDRKLTQSFEQVKANKGAGGIDGETIESYDAKLQENIMELLNKLRAKTYQAQPVRRVYIPKKNGKKRPLGIPTIGDRIVQQSIVNVLQPKFEDLLFHNWSVGYRPNRGVQRALQIILWNIEQGYNHIYDCDIKGFFDNIPHNKLIGVLKKYVSDRTVLSLVEQWLKAGHMEEGKLIHSDYGTPQGGVISPLLANVYLNELDWEWDLNGIRFVRYADDFLLFAKSNEEIKKAATLTKNKLAELGLEISKEKTRVVNFDKDDFDFLGFTFHHWTKRRKDNKPFFNVTPKEESIRDFRLKIKEKTRKSLTLSKEEWINRVNPIIRGKVNYYVTIIKAVKANEEYGQKSHCRTRWIRKILERIDGYIRKRLRVALIHKHPTQRKGMRMNTLWNNEFFLKIKLIPSYWLYLNKAYGYTIEQYLSDMSKSAKRRFQYKVKRAKEKGEEYFTPHRLQKMQNAWNASS